SLPHSMAVWILNAYVRFDRIVWIRFFLQGTFLLGVIYQYYFQPGLNFILICYLLSNLFPALLVLVTGWSKLRYFNRGNREMNRSLFNFGKFSMATMVGSNFLRSSDTFIIMSILGPGANAVYSVAERLIGLFDIPLRAFVAIAFPQLAKKYGVGLKKEFEDELETGAGFSTLLLLPISIVVLIFAEPMVLALGGEEYISSVNILRVFAIYTALTPLDRFTGIALDVINRPDLNFYKVVLMLTANVVGDILVLQYSDNLVWVAFISIITFGTGILFGILFLRRHISIHFRNIIQKGGFEFVRLVKKYVGNSV
ncbi:MAG: oligosaccharide flippase family protein, partial [Owenweeksia sp.]